MTSATDISSRSEAKHQHVVLDIEGMHCAGCASRVEKALSGVPGVCEARVNLVTHQASIEFEDRRVGPNDLVSAVTKTGYRGRLIPGLEDLGSVLAEKEAREAAAWRRRLVVGLVLLFPLLGVTYFSGLTGTALVAWQLLLATPIEVYVGWPYFIGAWRSLRHRAATMDTLIALGTGVAYLAGAMDAARRLAGIADSAMGSMYLLDAALILVFITLGKFLEAKAKGQASQAIRRLLDLTSPEATVLRDGQPRRVPVQGVMTGETILVRPGERVPLDARILSGSSSLDESWLTGESIPVDKTAGEEILAGTINLQGALSAEVVHQVGQTSLAQVIDLVRRAQESKTDVGRLADRVVAWFVPVVLAIALVALAAWGLAGHWAMALDVAVAVLVVACPCALGLATPTAILVGSGLGAQRGILIKDAHALETAGRLTTVVLDKTGTVTLGRPAVTAIHPADGIAAERLLSIAAAAEQLSQHPVAAAVVARAEAEGIEIVSADELELVAGQGIRARRDGTPILVGNERLMNAGGIDHHSQEPLVDALRRQGQTPLLVAADRTYLGCVTVADTIAPHSREAIAALRQLGLDVQLLSGDHRETAQAVAREVGIDEVNAEVLPEEKLTVVRRLQESGKIVAMVGDGINDAPALAAADLGVAMGTGSDVAIESADLVLVGQDLRAVVRAIRLSQATLRTIRQNLWWAFGYNALLLPLAAGVFVPIFGVHLPPIAAAAAMAASSVCVVSNSLLLRLRVSRGEP